MLEYAVVIGLAAFVFSEVLTAKGEVFYFIRLTTEKLRFPEWLEKPLWRCSKCVAGQWALWISLLGGVGWVNSCLMALCSACVAWMASVIRMKI